MKVNVERDIDVERLLINLNEKSKCSSVGMAGYDVTVSKQMLRDAHDVIKQLIKSNAKNQPKYKLGDKFFIDDNWYISPKYSGRAYGVFEIYKIDNSNIRGNGIEYYLRFCDDQCIKILVTESILNRNKLL